MKLPIWSRCDVHLDVHLNVNVNVWYVFSYQLYFLFLSKKTKINTNVNENEKITCAHFVNMFELLSLGIHACKAYNRTCYILTLSFIRWLHVFMLYAGYLRPSHSRAAHRVLLSSTEWTIRSE